MWGGGGKSGLNARPPFYYLIGENRISFQETFIGQFSELLNLIGRRGNIESIFLKKKACFSRTITRLKVTYMFMVFATSLVVLLQIF